MKLKVGVLGLAVLVALPVVALAEGDLLIMDPGTNFMLYSQNTNDGYSSGRGMVFHADEAQFTNGLALWTDPPSSGINARYELWEIQRTNGDLLPGAVLMASTSGKLTGGLDYHALKWDDFTLEAGKDYLARASYEEAAEQNWFYDFDPDLFGDPPVDIGTITLIDGTLGFNTSNFVAPPLALQVPEPTSLALLGIVAVGVLRRRR